MSAQPSNMPEVTLPASVMEAVVTPEVDTKTLQARICKSMGRFVVCKFLIGIPTHRLAELRKLREHYRVYLLSNTNPIMWNSKIKDEFTHEGLQREDYFDGMVTSFEAKALKPEARIFRYAAEKFGIAPEETVFLDDSQRNLDAAARLGFHTLLVAPGSEFVDVLADKGIK